MTLDRIVGNIDLAPTFLDIAGVNVVGLEPPLDGRSILPLVVSAPSLPEGSLSTGTARESGCGASDPCNGHGVCLKPLAPQCFCNTGYVGATCNACGAGYTGYPACVPVPWRDRFLIEYVHIYIHTRSFPRFLRRTTPIFSDTIRSKTSPPRATRNELTTAQIIPFVHYEL